MTNFMELSAEQDYSITTEQSLPQNKYSELERHLDFASSCSFFHLTPPCLFTALATWQQSTHSCWRSLSTVFLSSCQLYFSQFISIVFLSVCQAVASWRQCTQLRRLAAGAAAGELCTLPLSPMIQSPHCCTATLYY